MHSVLFVATIPPQTLDWADFLANLQLKLSPKDNEKRYGEALARLAENVWLINLEKSVEPLAWMASMAQARQIQYGILAFDEAPKWLPVTFAPEDWKAR